MEERVALAIAAHPDDIEIMMAGTLLQLARAGYQLHLLNIANGCCGSMTEGPEATARRRWEEAQTAAATLGAQMHPPLCNDLELTYTPALLRGVTAVVRAVQPRILLLHSPEDYMEDHMIACRLGVTAAFSRGMPNWTSEPPVAPAGGPVTVYHALPYGLRDGLGRIIYPGQYVDIGDVLATKRAALACHASQKDWLDQTQGVDSYLHAMEAMAAEVGRWSSTFAYAEGWRRHSTLGFCGADDDPLAESLGAQHCVCPNYRRAVEAGTDLAG